MYLCKLLLLLNFINQIKKVFLLKKPTKTGKLMKKTEKPLK